MLSISNNGVKRIFFGLNFVLSAALLILFASSWRAVAQTSSAGVVLGTVTDSSGAVVPGVEVDLTNTATNIALKQTTNDRGQYLFPQVAPGNYTLTFKADRFRTATVQNVIVEVNKSFTSNIQMQVGEVSQTVEVTSTAQAELQTTNAQIGDVVSGQELQRLPTVSRDALQLMQLQPGVTPGSGDTGGTTTGSRSDQNSITLDGLDVSENVAGGQGFHSQSVDFTGVDSISEFRVGVANSDVTFGRAAGAQVSLISRSGTNAYHGDAYWYHQNSDFNANPWEDNRVGIGLPGLRDNRVGVSIGGPVIKDKTFFFSNYEIHRFSTAQSFTAIVPTPTLRAGTLLFRDCSTGMVQPDGTCSVVDPPVAYPLATSTACGTGTTACDPRHLGISPTVAALWALLPPSTPGSKGIDPTLGDGLNSVGFRASLPLPVKDDDVSFRMDHNFSTKLHFFGRYAYARDIENVSGAVSILNDTATSVQLFKVRGISATGGLDYAISQNLLNSFRFGFVDGRNDIAGESPVLSATAFNLPGTTSNPTLPGGGLVSISPATATGGLAVPVTNTQQSRRQNFANPVKQFVENLFWTKNNHSFSFGTDIHLMPFNILHDDRLIDVTAPVASLDAGSTLTLSPNDSPPACAGTNAANCILPSDAGKYSSFYAGALGLLQNTALAATRNANLVAQPFLTPFINNFVSHAYDFYAQDTWRMTPSLTFTYGLAYGWQSPPTEKNGLLSFIANNDSNNQIITAQSYINSRQAAALQGNIFNPTLGFLPVRQAGRSIYNTDYGDWAPRVSIAWSPGYGYGAGRLGSLFGNRKTVVRAGFGISYDRFNQVSNFVSTDLGGGFEQTLQLTNPTCAASGNPGAGCNSAAGDPGLSSFRVGVDGSIPLPAFSSATSPVVLPQFPFPGFDQIVLGTDPNFKNARNYQVDFTVQREIPGNMLIEVGYAGRFARNLGIYTDLDAPPYFFKDTASGQTFAQAFDAIGNALRAGNTPAAQPWFENQLFPGATTFFASNPTLGFLISTGEVGVPFLIVDELRAVTGQQEFNNRQVEEIDALHTGTGFSNYNGAFVTWHKRTSHGLQFDLNYTFSKSLDNGGTIQNNAGGYATPFNTNLTYGPSGFDHTHVLNATYDYELPFGKGYRLSSSHRFVNQIIGGWYTAGIFTAATGFPITVSSGSDFGSLLSSVGDIQTAGVSTGVHRNVAGSGGVGTAGNPATGGSGINVFANPQQALSAFRPPLIATDLRTGEANPLRTFGYWNMDMSLAKRISFTERFKAELSLDAFNVFNNVNFSDFDARRNSILNATSPATFGVVTQSQQLTNHNSSARYLQLGLRIEF